MKIKRTGVDSFQVLLVGLWLMAVVLVVPAFFTAHQNQSGVKPSATINPNTARWWELAVLPRIGETMAKRIVELRSASIKQGQSQPFQNSNDLAGVRGIGPKTVQRIAPYLRFDH